MAIADLRITEQEENETAFLLLVLSASTQDTDLREVYQAISHNDYSSE